MNKNLKLYFGMLISGIILLFSIVMLVRYIIDPVGLNNRFNIGLAKDMGNSYRTQKFIEINKIKPNTIILGGSRVHYMQTKDLEQYTKDKVYNIGFPYSTLEEQYYFLKYSLENFEIKNVVIGLNFYTFSSKIENHNSDFNKDIFINGFDIFKQFNHYLKLNIIDYLKYVVNNENLKEPYYENGNITYAQERMTLKTQEDIRLNTSYLGYKNTYSKFMNFNINEYNENLEYYKKMIELCKKYKVNYYVFTTTINDKQLNSIKEVNKIKEYYDWKIELSKITPYWDFMYKNALSSKNENFIDTSHLKIDFVKYYLNTIFNNNPIENYGIYVDDKNINNSINLMKQKNGF